MARALWKGSISFGLVNIPIELYTAVRNHRPKFRMLHATDKSPVRFERVCIRDGHAVAWEDLVKGYEYSKGRFIVLTKEDFQAAAVEKTRSVDIIDFVKADEVDLMERLRRSLEGSGAKPRAAKAHARTRVPKKRSKSAA